MGMAAAQRQGQALHLVGHLADKGVHAAISGRAGRERRSNSKSASLDSMVSNASSSAISVSMRFSCMRMAAPREQGVARRLQPVGQRGMGVDQGAKGGGAFGVGIVERRLGAQVIGEGAHRFGQQQPPHPVVEQPGEQPGIGGVEQRAARVSNSRCASASAGSAKCWPMAKTKASTPVMDRVSARLP